MKRVFLIFSIVVLAVSCRNKDLCYLDHPHAYYQDVLVIVHWPDDVEGPATGIRTNLFQTDNSKSWINDLHCTGGTIKLPVETSYQALCYDYFGPENTYVRGENSFSSIEAYCGAEIRATYAKSFPDENTVCEADALYVDNPDVIFDNPKNTVANELHFYVENVTKVYTFEIRNVRGAKFITATRGALSGLSASYFLITGDLSSTPSTVLCNAAPDPATDRIIGAISTFGRVESAGGFENKFTIEILYPSAHNGIIQMTWDVTDQLNVGTHIIIDANIDIIPDANGGGSAFDVKVKEWDDIVIPIPA